MLCPMKLSDIERETKPLAIPFGGTAVLNIEYQVAGMTFARISEMMEAAVEASRSAKAVDDGDADEGESMRRRIATVREAMIGQLLQSLRAWDLEDEDGNPVPITEESLADIDVEIVKKIQKAIAEDQKATGGK